MLTVHELHSSTFCADTHVILLIISRDFHHPLVRERGHRFTKYLKFVFFLFSAGPTAQTAASAHPVAERAFQSFCQTTITSSLLRRASGAAAKQTVDLRKLLHVVLVRCGHAIGCLNRCLRTVSVKLVERQTDAARQTALFCATVDHFTSRPPIADCLFQAEVTEVTPGGECAGARRQRWGVSAPSIESVSSSSRPFGVNFDHS
jgi:hypothetical protein